MATATIDKQTALRQAVQTLKDSEYGVTALKIEVEGQLDRRLTGGGNLPSRDRFNDDGNCLNHCDGGRVTCDECEGGWENFSECGYCEGDSDGCQECTDGYNDCYECEEGTRVCYNCAGHGTMPPEAEGEPVDYSRDSTCHNFLMAELEQIGLTRRLTAEERIEKRDTLLYNVDTMYEPVAPLVYAKFYTDGSVDSEFTATISVANPDDVRYLQNIIDAWNKLITAVGHGCDIDGAGMHMALIKDPNCKYPSPRRDRDGEKLQNFGKSMGLLLPALYFLGTHSDKSRPLGFRRPEIGSNTHRSAIDFRQGALEYRIFDTCYDKPAAVLDNIMVMANTIKYWSSEYKPSGVEKKIDRITFGIERGQNLDRFYRNVKHIDILNAGLAILKPACYTIRELKQERCFKVNRGTFNLESKKNMAQAEREYKDYVERQKWAAEQAKALRLYDVMQAEKAPLTAAARKVAKAKAKTAADKVGKERLSTIKKLDAYVKDRVTELTNVNQGDYILTA